MSSLKGDGSGVSETEEVSMLASVSMGEEEISSGVREDLGRRTPWPVVLPGLSGVIYLHLYVFVSACSFFRVLYRGWISLYVCFG